ncbi:hypothetical protein [Chryseobacterium sp.]|uniref:hypothetical protein n=1 Tax=Chryseobacterium sp. TaxID=1871047 RepID=UPI00388F566B
MKKIILPFFSILLLISCNKIEEKIDQTVQETTEKIQQRAQKAVEETVKKTVNESINSLTNTEDVQFNQVFPSTGEVIVSEEKGKKFKFPNGSEGFIFKYKADKSVLIPFLERQATTDETQSDKVARKIDGQNIIDKISFIEKFLPENMVDSSFLDNIRNNKSIEYYKLKRYPYSSTLIYNPVSKTVLQYVEISK